MSNLSFFIMLNMSTEPLVCEPCGRTPKVHFIIFRVGKGGLHLMNDLTIFQVIFSNVFSLVVTDQVCRKVLYCPRGYSNLVHKKASYHTREMGTKITHKIYCLDNHYEK